MGPTMRCTSIGVAALVTNTGVKSARRESGGSDIGLATAANGAACCWRATMLLTPPEAAERLRVSLRMVYSLMATTKGLQ